MKVKVNTIEPHPLNKEIYSLSNIEDLVSSIEDVGLLQPIIINQNHQIISGHRRYTAIKELGWNEVEVEQRNINDEEVELYLVHANKQRIKSAGELLAEYHTLRRIHKKQQGKRNDLTFDTRNKSVNSREDIANDIGISGSQLGRLLYIEKNRPGLIKSIDDGILTIRHAYYHIQREKKDNLTTKPIKKGKVDIGGWTFYNKSSHDMSELEDGSVQLIFTSPPYYSLREYNQEKGLGNEDSVEEYVENLCSHFKDCFRVLNDKGSFYLNIGDRTLNGDLQNIPYKVVERLKQDGWILRSQIVWHKTNYKPRKGVNSVVQSWEPIFHLVKSKDYYYNPTYIPTKEDNKVTLPPNHRKTHQEETNPIRMPVIPNEKGKSLHDYWSEDVVRVAVRNTSQMKIQHQAPFNEELIILPILQTTKEGDIVLDPFAGSGTTLQTAQRLNRKGIGYDIHNFIHV